MDPRGRVARLMAISRSLEAALEQGDVEKAQNLLSEQGSLLAEGELPPEAVRELAAASARVLALLESRREALMEAMDTLEKERQRLAAYAGSGQSTRPHIMDQRG